MTCLYLARRLVASALLTTMTITALPAIAQDLTKTPNDAELRIAMADRNRLMIERMARASCFVGLDSYKTEALAELAHATETYARFHSSFAADRLTVDDAETESYLRTAWEEEDKVWTYLGDVYDRVLTNAAPVEPTLFVPQSLELSRYADQTFAHMRQVYGARAGLSDLSLQLLVDLYGRERVLIERIGTSGCHVARGHLSQENAQVLAESIGAFGVTLDALRNGAAPLGIVPPPSGPVADTLDRVATLWAELAPDLAAASASGEMSDSQLNALWVKLHQIGDELDSVSSNLAMILRPES